MAPSATAYNESYESLDQIKANWTEEYNGQNGREVSRLIAEDVMKQRVGAFNAATAEDGEGDSFYVADMGDVYHQHMRWKMNLARVKPHYAVKCNPDPEVLKLLAELGSGFDCASKAEIQMILGLGVDPNRIIFANPTKDPMHLRFAARHGVKQMTFDNADELRKTKTIYPDAELFLRIITDDSSSLCQFGEKFGASLDITKDLLALAKTFDLNVVGVSFHVGSGDADPSSPSKAASFVKAVRDARAVFDQAAEVGYDLKILDVGGGFSGNNFEAVAQSLSHALDANFPPSVRIISEPGRYYVSSAFTLASRIIGRGIPHFATNQSTSGGKLFLNDGVYGNFASIIFDHLVPFPRVLSKQDETAAESMEYTLWGQTCDGMDLIKRNCHLTGPLNEGDWLYFEDMGAYTKCCATGFNGFQDKHDVLYVSSVPGASALLGYKSRMRIGGVGRAKA